MVRLTIIGLGLIGGSLGLALKRAELANLEIVGIDNDWGVAPRARRTGAIDKDVRDYESAVEGASLVVIATPIPNVTEVLEIIAPLVGEDTIVTDTASTKRDILHAADRLLPEHVSFVGGHPVAGKEQSGLDAAEAGLFDGRAWAVTPSVHASEKAIKTVENMIALAGAQPVLIDAAEHDSYMGALSHLPLVVSTALFSLAKSSNAWEDLAVLAGPGFRDVTRLASTNPELSRDIVATNRDNLVHWLDRMIDELRSARAMIADAEQANALADLFKNAKLARDAFIEKPPLRTRPESEKERTSAGERFMTFMMGEYLMRGAKRAEELIREREERQ